MNHLKKLCLVIDLSLSGNPVNMNEYISLLQKILMFSKLHLFQIVILMKHDDENEDDNKHCENNLDKLLSFGSKLIESFQSLSSEKCAARPLVFKLHIKACHSDPDSDCSITDSLQHIKKFGNLMQLLIVNYLGTFDSGHIQMKFSWDSESNSNISNTLRTAFNRLDALLDTVTLENNDIAIGSDRDYYQFAITAQNKNISKDIVYGKQWMVD